MENTFAEMVLLIGLGALVYLGLRPIQRIVEAFLLRLFDRRRPNGNGKPSRRVIDIDVNRRDRERDREKPED